MNIFYVNSDPEIAAMELCKVHVRKMIVESAQILSTAHRVQEDYVEVPVMYKVTHKNHPSSIWARETTQNYNWLYEHFKALCEVYEADSGRVHATAQKLLKVLSEPPIGLPDKGLTPIAVCMPLEFQVKGLGSDVCYQNYLKDKYSEWMSREKPVKVEFPIEVPEWVK